MILQPLPREAICAPGFWQFSPPILKRERPVVTREAREPGLPESELPVLWAALDAITNDDDGLDYDTWRDVIYGIHWGCGGSDEGLQRVEEWSSRCAKYVAGYAEEKVWNYADQHRAGGITAATVFKHAASCGWVNLATQGAVPDAADFQPVVRVSQGEVGQGGSTPDNAGPAPVERGTVPKAKHLCTDQANANRLVAAYGSRVLVAAGRWYVWDDARWKPDEADVYRYACRLSAIVKDEARNVLAKAKKAMESDGAASHMERAAGAAEALEKWSTRCESKGTIEAAIGLARKMLNVDVSVLDRDPWLLNCRNGVVDLRTGDLRPHDPADFITKITDIEFNPAAQCPTWERVLCEITCETDDAARPLVSEFLQRWFGYCATGLVREQAFVVHWGDGGNGKSLVLDTVARVLGDYAGTAAPGLVAGSDKSERHPTEIAALLGKRMVTAHETREGVTLREDFVKQATGDDKLTARYMREDFFEFSPTHKIQLLTNHKPTIRGQDAGIWRRVLLVPYQASFGDADAIAEGRARVLADKMLSEKVRAELPGVLAWVVRGAVEWARGGLKAPDRVREASAAYRGEQDRVRQFLLECCALDAGAAEPLTFGMGGLYPAYCGWCKEGGWHALARNRFLAEVLRVVPGSRTVEGYGKGDTGGRRKVLQVHGVRLLPEH